MVSKVCVANGDKLSVFQWVDGKHGLDKHFRDLVQGKDGLIVKAIVFDTPDGIPVVEFMPTHLELLKENYEEALGIQDPGHRAEQMAAILYYHLKVSGFYKGVNGLKNAMNKAGIKPTTRKRKAVKS